MGAEGVGIVTDWDVKAARVLLGFSFAKDRAANLVALSAALKEAYEAGELAGTEKERARLMGEIAAIAGARDNG